MKLSLLQTTLLCLACTPSLLAASITKRASDSTTVNLGACSGSPQYFAQGILYGLSGSTPPQSYLQDLKVNYLSAGGAQTDAQPAGYSSSFSSYQFRFSTVVNYWKRIRQNGGVQIVKMADLWGADETTGSNFVWPGDNGNWTKYDAFIQQVISDVKSNGMAANSYTVQLELWNEPDINFGGRPQSQFNSMFVRGTNALRAAFPSGSNAYLPLVGPSTASQPGDGNNWWTPFLQYLQSNGGTSVQPDVWNWHMEGSGSNDPIPPAQYISGYVQQYGLNAGIGLQNNEYGTRPQQVPSYSAWFMARYERLKFNGLRGNWASGAQLNNLLAQLLIQNSDGSYSTTGDYQAHRYYSYMTGSPCTTTSGTNIDSYATASSGNATALIGSKIYSGTSNVVFTGASTQFGSATSLVAKLYNIPYNSGNAVTGWTLNSTTRIPVSNNQATYSFNTGNGNDAWAIRLTA